MKKQREYRDYIDLKNPILLYKKDLFELEKILKENPETDKIDIIINYNNTTIPAESFDELFSNVDLPSFTNKVSISMIHWIKKDVQRDIFGGVSVTMHYNHVNWQIHSIDNTWFLGKKAQLISFFNSKKPWYSFMHSIFTYFGGMGILFLFYSAYLFANNKYTLMILPVLTFMILETSFSLMLKQIIFPFVKINFSERNEKKIGLNEIAIIVGIVSGVLTTIQITSTFFK